MAPSPIKVEIKRQSNPAAPATTQKSEGPYRPGMNIPSPLGEIALNPVDVSGRATTPITYDSNCLEEICGSCAMLINGKATMACSALVDKLTGPNKDQTITLAPLSKFPVIRDLAVDRSVLFENLKKIKAWVPIDGSYDLGPGPRQAPQIQEQRYPLSATVVSSLRWGSSLKAQTTFPSPTSHLKKPKQGEKMIKLADARRIIAAAEKKAEELGQPMNVAVVDEGGNLIAFERMANAWLGSIDISQKKAWTSRAFDITTKDLGDNSQPGNQFFGIHASNDGKVMIFAGGIPLKKDGKVVGAIGVSGGSGEQDHAVAEAGAAAF